MNGSQTAPTVTCIANRVSKSTRGTVIAGGGRPMPPRPSAPPPSEPPSPAGGCGPEAEVSEAPGTRESVGVAALDGELTPDPMGTADAELPVRSEAGGEPAVEGRAVAEPSGSVGRGSDGLMDGSGTEALIDGSGSEALTEGSGTEGSGSEGMGSDGSGREGSREGIAGERSATGPSPAERPVPEAMPFASCTPAARTTATNKPTEPMMRTRLRNRAAHPPQPCRGRIAVRSNQLWLLGDERHEGLHERGVEL
jgi:hypothetical protein